MDSRRGLFGLVVVIVLVAATIFVARQLHHSGAVEDCLMQHRNNCGN